MIDTLLHALKDAPMLWWRHRGIRNTGFCLLAGICFGFGFLPLAHTGNLLLQSNQLELQTLLTLAGLALWLWCLPGQSGKACALFTSLFGLGSYTVGASWVYISIHTFGQTPALLAAGLTALFIVALSLIQALPWLAFPRLAGQYVTTWFAPLRVATSAGFCWVIGELLLTYVGTGFPWLLPGYVVSIGSLRQGWLPLIGIHGFDFLLLVNLVLLLHLLSSVILTRTISHRSHAVIALISLVFFMGMGFGAANLHFTQAQATPLTVRLVQGAIPQQLKWDVNYLLHILHTYDKLSQGAKPGTVIIWPEGAIPATDTDVASFLDYLQTQNQEQDVDFLVGLPLVRADQFYNGVFAISNAAPQTYAKRHLVPFGEYLPLARWLRGIINFFNLPMSDFSAGAKNQPSIYLRHVAIGPLICYEVAYPGLVGRSAAQSNLLLAISDDTWFGRSAAAWQQLQISRVRSAETQLPMILVGNDGYTGWIDSHGVVQQLLPRYIRGTLTLTITPREGKTPITRFYQSYWP